jgi:hypothetical protein
MLATSTPIAALLVAGAVAATGVVVWLHARLWADEDCRSDPHVRYRRRQWIGLSAGFAGLLALIGYLLSSASKGIAVPTHLDSYGGSMVWAGSEPLLGLRYGAAVRTTREDGALPKTVLICFLRIERATGRATFGDYDLIKKLWFQIRRRLERREPREAERIQQEARDLFSQTRFQDAADEMYHAILKCKRHEWLISVLRKFRSEYPDVYRLIKRNPTLQPTDQQLGI